MKKEFWIFVTLLLLVISLFSGCVDESENQDDNQGDDNNFIPPENGNNQKPDDFYNVDVVKTGSSYQTVESKPTSGWFTNGQDADILVNWFGFENSGGSSRLYHPMGITNDGQHLIVADTCNNRILIWNSLPTSNVAPDVVLGQTDFNTNTPGTAQDKLRWPVDIATDGEKFCVADAYNDRVLIWNSFPTSNGEPADLVLGQVDFVTKTENIDENSVGWPWAVWTNGEKLIVASTAGSSVLIWNSFPTINNQDPDLVLTNSDFGTPRNIESDGETYLVIGDHNARGAGRGGNFVWHSFPTSNIDYDAYFGGEVLWCSEVIGDDLYGTPGSSVVKIPDFLELDGDHEILQMDQEGTAVTLPDISFQSGDGAGLTYFSDGSTEISYFCLYNGGRIAGYLSKPEGREPDFTIGSSSNVNPLVEEFYFMDNPDPMVYDDSLVVLCGFTHRIELWNSLPDETGATPDIVYTLNFEPISCAVYDDKLYVIGRGGHTNGGFLVWNWDDFLNGEGPIVNLGEKIGDIEIREGDGIAFDEQYAYITANGVLYVWEHPFDWNSTTVNTIDLTGDLGQISSNGETLAAELKGVTNTIVLFDVDTITDDNPSYFELLSGFSGVHFNLPSDVFINDDYLFVADTSFYRVLAWNSIPTSSEDQPDIVLGQENFDSYLFPKFTRDGLFMPAGIYFDGSYLWVGEFKFSHRVLRYSIK